MRVTKVEDNEGGTVKTYSHIMRAVCSTPWAIQPQKLDAIMAFLELKLQGLSASQETIARIRAENEISAARAQNVSASSKGAVAVLPLYGLIMHRASMMDDMSGPSGTSTQQFGAQLRQALNDPSVQAIVIDIDSPGGSVDGVEELAQEIYAGRKQKKITAVSDCLCASAAYYLGSQATEFVVSPSSLTGSIGVYMVHEEYSKYLENQGVTVTPIASSPEKIEGNEYQPLTDDARAHMQEMVDTFNGMFEKAVARGRGVSRDEVQKKFGRGRVFPAQQAVKLGLADSVGTLDDVLAKHGVTRGGSQARADAPVPEISAATAKADARDCMCQCKACEGDDCDNCTVDGCDADGCDCKSAIDARKAKAQMERRRHELAVA